MLFCWGHPTLRQNELPTQNLVQMKSRSFSSHTHTHTQYERVYWLHNEALWGKQGRSQASSKMAWVNRGRRLAGRGRVGMVVRGRSQNDGSSCSLNFPQVLKERVPTLSYQLPKCGAEGVGLNSYQQSNIKNGIWLYVNILYREIRESLW